MDAASEPRGAFHELGFPDADELQAKADLLRFVAGEIRRRELTLEDAGELLDLDQPNVSALVNERLGEFSVERLMALIGRLGFAVSIHVEGSGVAFDIPLGVGGT